MYNSLQMLELADVYAEVRRSDAARTSGIAERAGPGPGLRARLGRSLIVLGERIAHGTSPATR